MTQIDSEAQIIQILLRLYAPVFVHLLSCLADLLTNRYSVLIRIGSWRLLSSAVFPKDLRSMVGARTEIFLSRQSRLSASPGFVNAKFPEFLAILPIFPLYTLRLR
jgi:hypothetical protein